jgi:predicted metal-dependent enzyme (double-stranded beta helix superfamily)
MTIASTRPLGSAGISRFSPAQLPRTARLFASDPELPTLVDQDRWERRWVELDSSPYLQIWLLWWPPGTHTGWHDHGDSAGAFLVAGGTLLEQTLQGRRRQDRSLTAGQGRSFGPKHTHHVANAGSQGALSVHLYTPRLTSMTQYDATPAGLRVRTIERAGVSW